MEEFEVRYYVALANATKSEGERLLREASDMLDRAVEAHYRMKEVVG